MKWRIFLMVQEFGLKLALDAILLSSPCIHIFTLHTKYLPPRIHRLRWLHGAGKYWVDLLCFFQSVYFTHYLLLQDRNDAMCMCVCVCVCVFIYICMYVCVCVCVCVCVYISPPSWTSFPPAIPPLYVITEHQIGLPVLYSSFLLVIYFTHW